MVRSMLIVPAALTLAVLAGTTDPPDTSADTPPPTPGDACEQPELGGEGMWLDTPEGAHLQAGVVGDGPKVAIFLHQTDGTYCGFARFVAWLAADEDIRAVLVNLCGKGESECPTGMVAAESGNAAVQSAAEWAVAQGAERVTVVGASLGGILALTAAATPGVNEHIDAVVDISGPAQFGDLDAEAAAPDVTVPVLMAGSETDWRPTGEDVRRVANLLGTDEVEVWIGERGHGWDLLRPADGEGDDTPFRRLVRDWITGEALDDASS